MRAELARLAEFMQSLATERDSSSAGFLPRRLAKTRTGLTNSVLGFIGLIGLMGCMGFLELMGLIGFMGFRGSFLVLNSAVRLSWPKSEVRYSKRGTQSWPCCTVSIQSNG